MLPILGMIIGILIGVFVIPVNIPQQYSIYLLWPSLPRWTPCSAG